MVDTFSSIGTSRKISVSMGHDLSDNQECTPSSMNALDQGEAKANLTIPGVLHFIQHEWSKHELERSQWEIEKVDLRAKITQLEGENKGHENLKRDLIRRVKMLEWALIQERNKVYKLKNNGQEPPLEDDEAENATEKQFAELLDAEGAFPKSKDSEVDLNGARKLLRHYLSEIGYNESILDVRSFRLKNLLGLMPDGDIQSHEKVIKAANESGDCLREVAKFMTDQNEEIPSSYFDKELDQEASEVLDEFSFLNNEPSPKKKSKPEWGIDQSTLNKLKENYSKDNSKKRNSAEHASMMARAGAGDSETVEQLEKLMAKNRNSDQKQELDRGSLELDNMMSNDDSVDIKDDFAGYDDTTTSAKWYLKYTFRSHYDIVRQMQFHPVDPVMITASEDGTAKLWNISTKLGADVKTPGSELEPVYTFRGHKCSILSMDMSSTGEQFFTADLNGIICVWNVPSSNAEAHENYDPQILAEKFNGHSNAIWGLCYQSSSNRLISASADKTLKIWELGSGSDALIHTYTETDIGSPLTIDMVAAEPQQIVAGYKNQCASIFDIEVGRTVLKFDSNPDDEGQISKILSHPTMPVTIAAGSDRRIRYFDNNSGKLIHSTVAHVESISTLAIDPNGLYLLSGCHDGSLRLWNMEKRTCLQEIAAHRKKFDMSVMSVAFHPSRPIIGSAGADSLAKIYTSQKSSLSSSSGSDNRVV